MLPQYFHVLKLANPGTITDIKTEKDKEGKTRFKYAFMSLKACMHQWMEVPEEGATGGRHPHVWKVQRCFAKCQRTRC